MAGNARTNLPSSVTSTDSSALIAKGTAEEYDYQHEYFPQTEEVKTSRGVEAESSMDSQRSNNKSELRAPLKDIEQNLVAQPQLTQSGRTIWSVSPEELSELTKDMTDMKKESTESTKRLSYAEASKNSLDRSAWNRAMPMKKRIADEQTIRTFTKYYGLPNIASFEPLHSDAEASEEKVSSFDKVTDTEVENKPQNLLDYSQIVGLSATTPTFYPRQTTDTNELIQMLKASLASKKVAPHMDWWPGDWKCTNCDCADCPFIRVEFLIQGHLQAVPSWASCRCRIRLPDFFR